MTLVPGGIAGTFADVTVQKLGRLPVNSLHSFFRWKGRNVEPADAHDARALRTRMVPVATRASFVERMWFLRLIERASGRRSKSGTVSVQNRSES